MYLYLVCAHSHKLVRYSDISGEKFTTITMEQVSDLHVLSVTERTVKFQVVWVDNPHPFVVNSEHWRSVAVLRIF